MGVEAGEDVVAAMVEGAVAEGGNNRGSSIHNENRATGSSVWSVCLCASACPVCPVCGPAPPGVFLPVRMNQTWKSLERRVPRTTATREEGRRSGECVRGVAS